MTIAVRHTEIVNGVAALIPSGNAAIVCNSGQDYALECIQRTFVAAEIGTGAGQTRDTTSNPTIGFLFAQFEAAVIKNVTYAAVTKDAAGAFATVFRRFAWASTAPAYYNLGFRIDNTTNPGYSSLYLLDSGSAATAQIATGDRVVVLVELGGILSN